MEAEKLVEETKKDITTLKKKIVVNTERRKTYKNRHKAAAMANLEQRELHEFQAKLRRLERDAKYAREHPQQVDMVSVDESQAPLGPVGEHYRKLWKKEDQAIEDALNPGAARRRQRYEDQQRRQREADEKTIKRKKKGRNNRRNANGDGKKKGPLKIGDVCEVSESKSGKTSRAQINGIARIVKVDKKNGTYDVKYVVGNSVVRGILKKYVRHEGESRVDSDEENADVMDALKEENENDKGVKLRLLVELDGTDPVPNRPKVKSPDGSDNTDFVLRCWVTNEGNDVNNSNGGNGIGNKKNGGGRTEKKNKGGAKNNQHNAVIPVNTNSGSAASNLINLTGETTAISWHPVPHDGTAGLEMSKDSCGSHEIALPKVLAGHSLFFGASGTRLHGNRKLRNFNGTDENNKDAPVTMTIQEMEVINAPEAEEVDEIYAEMEYLQWKLRVIQKQNETMATKFTNTIEYQVDEEAKREKYIANLYNARIEYMNKFNNEQERLRRQMEQKRQQKKAEMLKQARERKYGKLKAQQMRQEKERMEKNRGHKKKLAMSALSRKGRTKDRNHLQNIMNSVANGYFEGSSRNDSVEIILNNIVTFISMYCDESLFPEELKKRKELALKKKKHWH